MTGTGIEITPDIALQRLDGMIEAKRTWIRDHGHKRGEAEVSLRSLDMEVLQRVRDWLAKGIEKKRAQNDTRGSDTSQPDDGS